MNTSILCSKFGKFNSSQIVLFKLQTKILSRFEKPSTFNVLFPSTILSRAIKTQGGPRKGKLTVVKKRINKDFNIETVETEEAASVVKRFNFENKHLFGGIVNAVQKTCEKITGQTVKKKKSSLFHKTIMTYPETQIPIQDVKPHSLPKDTVVEYKASPFLLTERVSDSILNFPLVDKFQSDEEVEHTINKCNYLRQCLEKVNNAKKYPSVTHILEETMPPERVAFLQNWKLSMIQKLGEDGFEKYQKDILFNGSSLHQCITGYLSNIPELKTEVLPSIAGHWQSMESVLPSVKEVRLLEENITHPFLCYKGVVDCLAKFGDHFVVIDWKTSQKPKLSLSSTYDNPLQIAAYVGALNFDPKFKYMVSKGLIVVAYENGTPATVHFLNENSLLDYWNKWLQRLRTYWAKVQAPSS